MSTASFDAAEVNRPLLEAISISRMAQQTQLLNRVDLSLHGNQRVAIVGPSGSGKSVLLRALALLDPLSTGEIHWHGKPVIGEQIPAFRASVIYLHQRPALPDYSVLEILQQPFQLAVHQKRSFDPQWHNGKLRRLGRDASLLEKKQRTLSGGETQLVAFLRALQLEPQVLLLDEPTAALDPETSLQVEQLVADWMNAAKSQRATLWITHHPDQATRIADTVWHMAGGELRIQSKSNEGL